MQEQISNIIDALNELQSDNSLPKNIKTKIEGVLGLLKSNDELSIVLNKVMHELDDVANDSNLPSYLRSELWNIVSMLESVQ
jgi:hypothetical protein